MILIELDDTTMREVPEATIFRVIDGVLLAYEDANSEALVAYGPGEWKNVERVIETPQPAEE